jgi:hypothetical protein
VALLTTQTISAAGLAPTFTAVNASDTITADPGSKLFLEVKNANAASCTVTITDAGSTPAGSAASNPTVTVPATTGDRMIALSSLMAAPATGLITVSYSVTASVTAAVFRQ